VTTLKELSAILGGLSALYPRYELTEVTIKAYYRVLGDIGRELLDAAALTCGSTGTFFPSASELRKAAAELRNKAEGVPSMDEAWAEITKSFSSHGAYRGAPDWSHPLVGNAVAALGGYAELCRSENAMADRAHFMKIYGTIETRYKTDMAMLPAARAIVERLAAQMRPQLTSGDDD